MKLVLSDGSLLVGDFFEHREYAMLVKYESRVVECCRLLHWWSKKGCIVGVYNVEMISAMKELGVWFGVPSMVLPRSISA